MAVYKIQKEYERYGELSENGIAVMRMFGLTKQRLYRIQFECDCKINIEQGDIVYITGPSGTGKTVILNEIKKQIPPKQRVDLSKIKLQKDKAVIDCINSGLSEALKYLSAAGLADCYSLLNKTANLSKGQLWRLKLAIGLSTRKPFIFADEFCSLLDRITASTIAANIYKYAKTEKVTFILASAHQDFLRELLPDAIVTRDFSNNTQITYKKLKRQLSLRGSRCCLSGDEAIQTVRKF